MSFKTSVGWAKRSWNPISGCSPVSEGCINCYAARMAGTRLAKHPKYAGLAERREEGSYKFTDEVRYHSEEVAKPLRWKKPSRVFVCSMSDLFHDKMREGIARWERVYNIFWAMLNARQHIFMVLTKRPANMVEFFDSWLYNTDPIDHIYWGVTAENQHRWDERSFFLNMPVTTFVSLEPLLSHIDLGMSGAPGSLEADTPNLVIVGAETGPGRRKPEPAWIKSIVGQCFDAHVPIFMKDNLREFWHGPLIQEYPK